MGMPDTAHRYTVDQVLAFPEDGNRYELARGELLVTPAPGPRHQIALASLHATLQSYLVAHPEHGLAVFSPADITWDQATLVQPDIFVVPPDEVTNDWRTYKTLLLAIEILSPSSARADRVIKRRLYQENGVATYWVVDIDAQMVEVWHPEDERPEIVTETLVWRVASDAPVMTIELEELFAGLPE
jgi:Uma2 family endonuclease